MFVDRLRTAPAGLTGTEATARRHVTLALLAAIDAIETRPPNSPAESRKP